MPKPEPSPPPGSTLPEKNAPRLVEAPSGTPIRMPKDAVLVLPGEASVISPPNVANTTLGSCVSVVMMHPGLQIAVITHAVVSFSGCDDPKSSESAFLFLSKAAESRGVPLCDFRAFVLGGSTFSSGRDDIGEANIDAAMKFLSKNRIPVVDTDTGGCFSRLVVADPRSLTVTVRKTRVLET